MGKSDFKKLYTVYLINRLKINDFISIPPQRAFCDFDNLFGLSLYIHHLNKICFKLLKNIGIFNCNFWTPPPPPFLTDLTNKTNCLHIPIWLKSVLWFGLLSTTQTDLDPVNLKTNIHTKDNDFVSLPATW